MNMLIRKTLRYVQTLSKKIGLIGFKSRYLFERKQSSRVLYDVYRHDYQNGYKFPRRLALFGKSIAKFS